ncbi:MAG: hypothetical protein ACI86C_000004 [Candidatus Latescibacterota bacterium]|jgi:hypothetical protein
MFNLKNKKRHTSSLTLRVSGMMVIALFFVVQITSAQIIWAVDSTAIKIGEEITYTIEVQADSTDMVVFPEGQTFLPLEVIDAYKIDTTYEKAKYKLIKKYGLTQFDSGYYTIPKQKVFVNDLIFETDSIQIEVKDIVVDTTKQKMFHIKEVLAVTRPPFDFSKLFFWVLPILLILGVLAYILFRRKKRKEVRDKELPPYEQAITALKVLDSSNLLIENKSKEYYSTLTEIVKRYLDREVDDAALESTSDELIERLQLHKDAGHFDFDSDTITHLDQILKRADLVKFAKMHQQSGQAEADRNTIETIINDTHEAIPEPTEEELMQNQLYLEERQRKRRTKRIIYGMVTGFVVILITIVVLISTYGLSFLKDNIIGHPTKELAEGRWIKSEYGNPAVIIETPKVLVRNEQAVSEEMKSQFKSHETFSYGRLLGNFNVTVTTMEFMEPVEVDLDAVLEQVLVGMEQMGVTNMVVKKDTFSTDKGIEGVRAFGDFKIAGDTGQGLQKYEVIIFGQKTGLQQILITNKKGDTYANDVVSRIIGSIELEITEGEE